MAWTRGAFLVYSGGLTSGWGLGVDWMRLVGRVKRSGRWIGWRVPVGGHWFLLVPPNGTCKYPHTLRTPPVSFCVLIGTPPFGGTILVPLGYYLSTPLLSTIWY